MDKAISYNLIMQSPDQKEAAGLLEMKAYFSVEEPFPYSEIYITNSPGVRKILHENGIHYQGWVIEDGAPAQEKKAPTLKIMAAKAAEVREQSGSGEPPVAPGSVSDEEMELVISLLQKKRYKLFTDFDNFIRLEKYNKFPGRMLAMCGLMLLGWVLLSLMSR